MQFMKWWTFLAVAWISPIVVFSTACTHEGGVQASSRNFSGGDSLPFAQISDKGGISPTASLVPAEIPAGTPITVRIESPVSSASSQAGDSFQALLDVPIVVDGRTVAPAGSAVAGKVVAAKAAAADNEFGYVRITLTSVSLQGNATPIQTATLFVKASGPYAAPGASGFQAQHPATNDVEFPSERRLTFRLNRALSVRQ